MSKVKVNSIVDKWIKDARGQLNRKDNSNTLYNLIGFVQDDYSLKMQNITLTDLARAIEEGYEVEYEFKDKDLIRLKTSKVTLEYPREIYKPNFVPSEWILVCKVENREDLK